mgnify:CR=1 FL=1
MIINSYVNFRKPYSAPLAIKSERQLRFTRPIVLANGCSLTFPKLKKQKSSGLYSGNSKEVQAM